MLERLLHRPRALLLRRVVFQIHLWLGLLLGIYLALIGVTGSLLVFRQELSAWDLPAQWRALRTPSPVSAGAVVGRVTAAYPNVRLVSLTAPSTSNPTFVATLGGASRLALACDPTTGEPLGPMPAPAGWLTFIRRLHETLLINGSGRVWNGVGAALLLLLAATGIVNWWPGIRHWRRSMRVDLRRGWRRITFDLHSAAGFWAVLLLVSWAVTGIYFAWPRQILRLVDAWSPIVSARPPTIAVGPGSTAAAYDLDALVARASALDPGTQWRGVFFPYSRQAPLQVILLRPGGEGRQYEDTVYFDPYSGEHLGTWRYGVNESWGDLFIWLQVPLHFGTSWGLPIKVLWALAGLVLPLLALTGLVMYWNRVLRHAWKRLGAGRPPECTGA